MKFTGIILAGGKSSRMGTNKALLELQGKTMLAHAVDNLSEYCDELLISGNTEEFRSYDLPIVHDEFQDCGPLGGIHTCLNRAKNEHAIIVSCDTPLISKEIIEALVADYRNTDALVASCNGRLHPLIGIYRKSTLKTIENNLKNGNLRMTETLDALDTKYREFPSDFEAAFSNINTPEELQQWTEQ